MYNSWDYYDFLNKFTNQNQTGGARPNRFVSNNQYITNIFVVKTNFNNNFNIINKEITITDNSSFTSNNYKKANDNINNFFDKLFAVLIQGAELHDKIFFTLFHPSLDMPIGIPFIEVGNLSPQIIADEFIKVCQSKRFLRIDSNLEIRCTIAKVLIGSGLIKVPTIFDNLKCLIRFNNRDNLCAIRAFLIGVFIADENKRVDNYKRDFPGSELNIETLKVAKAHGIENYGCGIRELSKLEYTYKDYQLTIFNEASYNSKSYKPIYLGPPENKTKYIYLFLYKNHYDVIRSPSRFFNFKKFCHFCKKPYNHLTFHKCEFICYACKQKRNICKPSTYIKCEGCELNCLNNECFRIHKEKICIPKKICNLCNLMYPYKHVCSDNNKKYCVNCVTMVNYDHRCFIKKEKMKVDTKFRGYIFFDYEASQENKVHVPNLVIAHKYSINYCLEEKKFFYDKGKDVNNLFCTWLFNQEHYLAVAHNLKGYDGIFIMNYLLNNINPDKTPPNIINQGNKILRLDYNYVRIIDSFMFLPMPLSEFSKTFKLKETKGYFPHFFNTLANQYYNGKYPEKEFYGSKHFTESKKAEFDIWYDSIKDINFDFQSAIFDYCESDVDILAKGCIAFIKIIQSITNIDPLVNSTTLASLCHLIYRQNYMIEDSIAVIPEMGYNPEEKSSRKAYIWLKYLSLKNNIKIQHSKNGFEKRIGKFKLDGYCDGVGYEFHGCIFHGCPICFSPRSFNAITQESMELIYTRHNNRISYLKSQIKIVEIWEHEWDKMVKEDLTIKIIVRNQTIREPLNIRHALFGGRTNAVILYYKVKLNEKILHYDVTSLYPFTQRDNPFPIGNPTIITEGFDNVENYFGFIFCSILPPNSLYFPILPVRSNDGKLVFPLCLTCQEEMITECIHTKSKRSIEGTWCTEEIKLALENGYLIQEIYEVYHFEKSSKELFRKYINSFLKIKQEASGFPDWVKNEDDKIEYQTKYLEKEGILLDLNKITKNPGLRKIAKLLLNTLWGRFGMNTNKNKIKTIIDLKEWYLMISNDMYTIHAINQSNPDILQVVYSELSSLHIGGKQTNVAIAAFVTSYARIKLWKTLNDLDRRVLYYDTDSVVFISDDEFEKDPRFPKLGDYLGDWTDELNGSYITEFVSAGPKNYAKRIVDPKKCDGDAITTECVVKGFSLSHIASLQVNFESMKSIVVEDNSKKLFVNQSRITSSRTNWELRSSDIDKAYGMTYDKRILKEDFTTLPYGFINK